MSYRSATRGRKRLKWALQRAPAKGDPWAPVLHYYPTFAPNTAFLGLVWFQVGWTCLWPSTTLQCPRTSSFKSDPERSRPLARGGPCFGKQVCILKKQNVSERSPPLAIAGSVLGTSDLRKHYKALRKRSSAMNCCQCCILRKSLKWVSITSYHFDYLEGAFVQSLIYGVWVAFVLQSYLGLS